MMTTISGAEFNNIYDKCLNTDDEDSTIFLNENNELLSRDQYDRRNKNHRKIRFRRKYIKLTTENENHRGFQFKTGVNTDIHKFTSFGECKAGGIYFTDMDSITQWIKTPWNHYYYRYVYVPRNAQVYLENLYSESVKIKADIIILSERHKIIDDVGVVIKICSINGKFFKQHVHEFNNTVLLGLIKERCKFVELMKIFPNVPETDKIIKDAIIEQLMISFVTNMFDSSYESFDICEKAMIYDPENFKKIPLRCITNDMCKKFVMHHPKYFTYIPDEFIDVELCGLANIDCYPDNFRHIPPLFRTVEMCNLMFRKDEQNIIFIPFNKMCTEMLKCVPKFINYERQWDDEKFKEKDSVPQYYIWYCDSVENCNTLVPISGKTKGFAGNTHNNMTINTSKKIFDMNYTHYINIPNEFKTIEMTQIFIKSIINDYRYINDKIEIVIKSLIFEHMTENLWCDLLHCHNVLSHIQNPTQRMYDAALEFFKTIDDFNSVPDKFRNGEYTDQYMKKIGVINILQFSAKNLTTKRILQGIRTSMHLPDISIMKDFIKNMKTICKISYFRFLVTICRFEKNKCDRCLFAPNFPPDFIQNVKNGNDNKCYLYLIEKYNIPNILKYISINDISEDVYQLILQKDINMIDI